MEPNNTEEALAWIQENCRTESWNRIQDEDSLYYREVSVKLTLDTGEIVHSQNVLDQTLPLNLFYTRAAKLLFSVKAKHEELKEQGL